MSLYLRSIVTKLAESNPVSELYGSSGTRIGVVCALCNQMGSGSKVSHLDDCPYKMALDLRRGRH